MRVPRPLHDHWESDLEALQGRLGPFGLILTDTHKSQYLKFADAIARWNRRMNLLSPHDLQFIVKKHIAACLGVLLASIEERGEPWVDIGTGSGLPGIVVNIWYGDHPITLIEGSRKKCAFLEMVMRDLGLKGLEIVPGRVETMLAKGERVGAYGTAFCRAVADLETTLREFGGLLRPGGALITHKGPGWADDVRGAEAAGLIQVGAYQVEQTIRIPWAAGHLLIVRKAD